MKSKNRLKEIDTKNRACYYFDDIFSIIDINFSNILSNKKLYENISVYDTSHEISMDPRPLCIRFDEIDLLLCLMVKLSIWYYLIMNCSLKFVIRLDIL